jgi:hypothetical protein
MALVVLLRVGHCPTWKCSLGGAPGVARLGSRDDRVSALSILFVQLDLITT